MSATVRGVTAREAEALVPVLADVLADCGMLMLEAIERVYKLAKKRAAKDYAELLKQLKKHGLTVARRTITKYRQKMGIGSSRHRMSKIAGVALCRVRRLDLARRDLGA